MSNAGKKVRTHYVGTLDDGTKFDSSVDRGEPIEFVCMAGQMIPGFDAAVENMQLGETKNVRIPAAEAYGEHNPDFMQHIPVGVIPGLENESVGSTITLRGPDAEPVSAVVVEVDDQIILLDFNHELAGKNLNFEITLVEVSDR